MKKFGLLCFALAIFMLASSALAVFAEKGDVDGDGNVTTTDYLLIKSHFLKRFELSKAQKEQADVNGDGTIDSTDYLLIKARFLGVDVCTDESPMSHIKSDYAALWNIMRGEEIYKTWDVTVNFFAGPFSGAYVVYIRVSSECFTELEWSWTAAGATAYYDNGQELMYYKKGNFKTLRQAYEDGDINDEDVKTVIYRWNNSRADLPVLDPEGYRVTDATVANQLKTDYAKSRNALLGSERYTADDIVLKCVFGRFDGAYVVYINARDEASTANVWSWEAAGMTFDYYSGQELLHYRNGEFKTLRSVFDQGEISADKIRIIAYLWKNRAS